MEQNVGSRIIEMEEKKGDKMVAKDYEILPYGMLHLLES